MQEAISQIIAELALALLALAATAIGVYASKAGKAVKDRLESSAVREWAAGLKDFYPPLHAAALQFGELAEELVRDSLNDLTDADRYQFVEDAIMEFAENFEERTGVKWRPSKKEVDALVRRAIREGQKSFEENFYGAAVKPLAPPEAGQPPGPGTEVSPS